MVWLCQEVWWEILIDKNPSFLQPAPPKSCSSQSSQSRIHGCLVSMAPSFLWLGHCPVWYLAPTIGNGFSGVPSVPLLKGQQERSKRISQVLFFQILCSLATQHGYLLWTLEWVSANSRRKPFPGNYSMINGGKIEGTVVHADQYMDPIFPRRVDLWMRENIYHSWQLQIALFLENKWTINFYMHPLTPLYLPTHQFLKSLVRPRHFPFFTGSILVSTQL